MTFGLSYRLDCDPTPHLELMRQRGDIDPNLRDLITADVGIEVGGNSVARHHVSLIYTYLELYDIFTRRLGEEANGITITIDSDPVAFCKETDGRCRFYYVRPGREAADDNRLGVVRCEEILAALSAMRRTILDDLQRGGAGLKAYLDKYSRP